MDVILYMAVSLNGCIARTNNETDFVSEDEWKKGYIEAVNDADSIIIGRITYEVMCQDNEFTRLPKNLFVVVVSEKQEKKLQNPNHTYASNPDEALLKIKERGFKKVLVAGGTKVNGAFLKQNLINRVILDVEPVLIGSGKNLCEADFMNVNLKFDKTVSLTQNLIQMHYSVIDKKIENCRK